MLTGTLPHYIDAPKWADREATIQAIAPLSAFARVCEGAVSSEGEVSVDCRVYRDSQHLIVLEGQLQTTVQLVCQRCLSPVASTVDTQMRLWLLFNEGQADRLADDADYLVLDGEGHLSLIEVLEDELILSLPLVALHEDCETRVSFVDEGSAEEHVEPQEERRENPFQVLASLKSRTEN
jgi:uncharacterized protein